MIKIANACVRSVFGVFGIDVGHSGEFIWFISPGYNKTIRCRIT